MSPLGVSCVAFVRQRLEVEPAWSQAISGGFVWWPHRLAQYVWVDPPANRVYARTDLVVDFNESPASLAALASPLRRASLSGLARHPRDPGRLQLACVLQLTQEHQAWMQNLFALAVLLQAGEALRLVQPLAQALGARPAWSAHSSSGMRSTPHEILEVVDEMSAAGKEPSRFRGRNLLEAFAMFRQSPFPATGDETQLEVQVPAGKETARLQLTARTGHPDLGNGLYQKLTLPGAPGAANDPDLVRQALQLNERELQENTQAHVLGSWCPAPTGLMHAIFYPNYLAGVVPRSSGLLAQADVMRARWVTFPPLPSGERGRG